MTLSAAPLERFDITLDGPVLYCIPTETTWLESLGEQASLFGKHGDSLEIWIYPFKLVSKLTIEYFADNGKTFTPAKDMALNQISSIP